VNRDTRIPGVLPVRTQGQHWIEAIQCRDGGFFVNAEHGPMLRRIQIEPYDLGGLFFPQRFLLPLLQHSACMAGLAIRGRLLL